VGERSRNVLVTARALAIAAVGAGLLAAVVALPWTLIAGGATLVATGRFEDMPGDLNTPPLPQRSVILAADGSKLATFYYENRVEVPLDRVAPIMRKAIVAIEDSRFYEHGAIDVKGTLRALLANAQAGTVTQGGSTLSQQYVKNALAESADTAAERHTALETTALRKLKELRYAVGLEKRYTKDQILQGYLNIAYFGDGAYGVEAAARHYFGEPAAALDLEQSATLAGVVRSPQTYNPDLHPVTALTRRNVVLTRMAQLKIVDQATAGRAMAAPLGLRVTDTPNGCVVSGAPFFCDYVQREILNDSVYGPTAQARQALLQRGGLQIHTTLDPHMQKAAQRAVNDRVPPDNREHKAATEVLIQPGTGDIRAMAIDRAMGSDAQRGKTWINLAADADHGASLGMQAGSTFKIFTLAAALDKGIPFGAKMWAPNGFVPTGYTDCAGHDVGDHSTVLGNAGDGEGGRTFTLMTGTWNSVNTFFLGLERRVGLCDTVKMAERLGMRQADGNRLEQRPSFTLGFNEVSPVRLAAAYAAFAARGKYCGPTAITGITDSRGHWLAVADAKCHQAVDTGVADAVNHVLRGVLTKGTAKGQGIGRPAAGKTGTVDNFSAAWFAGYTPDLAGAVWVGDPRGGYAHPLRDVCLGGSCYGEVFGADIPAPIWHDTMVRALRGTPRHGFAAPPGDFYSDGSGEEAPSKSSAKQNPGSGPAPAPRTGRSSSRPAPKRTKRGKRHQTPAARPVTKPKPASVSAPKSSAGGHQ
jgi:membrane peptidoglycan carboxypeptidase